MYSLRHMCQSHILLLLIQYISPTSSLPHAGSGHNHYAIHQAGYERKEPRLAPRDQSIDCSASWVPFAPNPCFPTAYEASDGAVQVTYSRSVDAKSSVASNIAPFSSMAYDTYTPVPRQYASTSPASSQGYSTTIPDGALTSLTTHEVQTATVPAPTDTSGTVHISLETSGNPPILPFPSISLALSPSLTLINTSAWNGAGPTATAKITGLSVHDIFQPMATDAPPPQILSRSDHPVPRLNIQQQPDRLETNKFYSNFFLGDQNNATWTNPYSVSWSAGAGQTNSYGLAISHVEAAQFAFGAPTKSDAGEASYFASILGLQSLVISAAELTDGTTLTTDTLAGFSINVNLLAAGATSPTITFPIVQGMGFVTGCYNSATPLIQSGIGIENITYAGAILGDTTFKYRADLSDGTTWLIYVTPKNEGYQENSFTLVSPKAVQGQSGFGGCIQIAKVPTGSADLESVYDESAGAYATSVNIRGSVKGTTGRYHLNWVKEGAAGQPLLMFALPHQVESFGPHMTQHITDIQLQATTKGIATAVQCNSWSFIEPDLPIDMSFNPWTPELGDISELDEDAVQAINAAATEELAQNVSMQTNGGSMYFDGKALAKFATIVYVAHDLAHNATLAFTGLQKLVEAFDLHVSNLQVFPLVYDTAWGGAVSISTYLSGNPYDDFGNTYYNDHHFHYGYFLYAAAVIGYLDPTWLTNGTNAAWVNMLARDYANPISTDSYYPFSRAFDWYAGHSWAAGLFPSADGKNQESSSEDTMASYGLKMWGKITGNVAMEARGNLMLAIQARSLRHYFLYTSDNTIEPLTFIGNKVSGILFENKIDHTTYFGNNTEYIQGIHMLPIMPFSTLTRSPTFVQEEWDAYNFDSYAANLTTGWRGILMANYAIVDPGGVYDFFRNGTGEFQMGMLDGGASWTWYLAWCAGLKKGVGYGGR